MTPPSVPPDDRSLVASFERQGCARIDTDVLQPAALFIELSGEDIRRRLYLTQDAEGRELCLRPEYTIPVCRRHLELRAGRAAYCYQGPVFRQRGGGAGEFLQAGFEFLGDEGTADADARAVAVTLEALAAFGGPFEIGIGDMGLLAAMLDALHVPSTLRRRLVRALAAGRGVADLLAPESGEGRADYEGLLAAIAGQDPRAARAFIEDVISIAGVAQVGGRSAGEIAERFLARAEQRTRAVPDEAREILVAYTAVSGPPDAAARSVRAIVRGAGLPVERELDLFDRRAEAFAAQGVDAAALTFRADFVRTLDYYTGFILEARRPGAAEIVAAGGRYDGLLHYLGAPAPVPAIGCSFWIDRLSEAAR